MGTGSNDIFPLVVRTGCPPCGLSSTDFLHKEIPVVKKTTKEKVRKKSQSVVLNYVNQNEYPQISAVVENPCGKVCGECGKAAVFNRYPGVLDPGGRMHNPMHNPRTTAVALALCYRAKEMISRETLAKKLERIVKRM